MSHAADLLLTGGSVFTADAALTVAEAVAVRDGRIAWVGPADEAGEHAGPATRVLELEGRTVLPGFQDAHCHPAEGGVDSSKCVLNDALTREACLEAIARYAAEHPELEWIEGSGWSIDSFEHGTPSRADLDAILPDRPAFLTNRDGHGAWVNSRALELAGITRETPDPSGGRIERDAAGEPQGTLHEEALDLVWPLMPPWTQEEWEAGILVAQAEFHALGITAWQDARIGGPVPLAAYRAVAERGELTMRVEGNLLWDRNRGREQIDDLLELRAAGSLGRLRVRGAKIFADGVLENFTGALLEPYVGTDNHGISMLTAGELEQAVVLLDAHGFQVHVHTIGDRAVRDTLDALEAAERANGRRDSRHHLAHLQLVHPDDLPRFAELGVAANVSPLWACHGGYVDELTIPFIGPERSARMYPFGSLVRAGARLVFGSDWTVSTNDPLPQLEVAVTRVDPDARGREPLLPEEALDLPTALAAFTGGSAFVNFLEADTGTVEPSKLADLVVLDRNVLDPGAGPIGDARVLLTLSEGEAVYADPGLGW
ncbi:MAG TPA: amidohydrolase [Gaiellaceae bacterium]|nr:amidohydrolase [Gaiellaceae bacterium]